MSTETVNQLAGPDPALPRRRLSPVLDGAAGLSRRRTVAERIPVVRTIGERLGWSTFGAGFDQLPTLDQFRRSPDARRRAVRFMMADSSIKGGFLQKVFAIQQLDLASRPADPSRKVDRLAAEFAGHCLKNEIGDQLLPGTIWNIAHSALADGCGVCEPVWQTNMIDRGRWKGKLSLAAIKPRPATSYHVEVDEFDNILGVMPTGGTDRRMIPASELVIFPWLPLFGSPLGMSDFEAAYKPFLSKLVALRLREIYLDRHTGPFLVAKTNNPDDADLHSDLAAARACGFMAIGVADDLQLLNLATGTDEVFNAAIESYDRSMLISFMGSYLHTIESKQGNARGNTAEHRNVAELFEWALASAISGVLTRQVGRLLTDKNFNGAGYPVLTLSAIDPTFAAAQLALGSTLRANGVPTKLSQWRGVSGWEQPTEPEDTLPGVVGGPAVVPGTDPNRDFGPKPAGE
jgi:hypothetical protein